MSYCVSHGKDKVMFLTEEELKKPSSVVLPEDEEVRGFVLPNGEINWGCPCLGNMVVGPCSVEFRGSLSCFHNSTADPKGSDCLEQFKEMNECMDKYPALYRTSDDKERIKRLDDDLMKSEGLDSNEDLVTKDPPVLDTNSKVAKKS